MFYNNKKETQRNSKENFWPAVDWTYFFLPCNKTKSWHVLPMDIHHYFCPNWRHISFSWSLFFLQVLQENVAAIGACCCMSPPAGKYQLRVSVLIVQMKRRRQGLLSSLIETDTCHEHNICYFNRFLVLNAYIQTKPVSITCNLDPANHYSGS